MIEIVTSITTIIHARDKKYFFFPKEQGAMILSLNGLLSVAAAYVNLVQIALFLDIDTENSRTIAKHPIMRLLFLYSFAYSITPNKMACALSVAIFFVFEVKNFIVEKLDNDGPG
ncbi:unknown [Feldmannia species virus]|uniref:Uncharacterized protein n=1 Tax=Feldmannia species virus TaxID=39420 RepID=B5LWJ3_9PHYC|nr:hypothetical protein FeldSpV_gp104 [Feldmannia species virus]ACH46856.1 unknown [Feldmannia species virus]